MGRARKNPDAAYPRPTPAAPPWTPPVASGEPTDLCEADLRVWRLLPETSLNRSMVTRGEWLAFTPDERERRRTYQTFLDRTRDYMKAQTERSGRSRIAQGVRSYDY